MFPILFTVGRHAISSYTAVLALALALALLGLAWQERRQGDGRLDAALWALLAAAAVGRLAHLLANWATYAERSGEALRLIGPGLSLHAALLGGLAGLALYAGRSAAAPGRAGRRFRELIAALAPALAFGLAAGWLACWLGGCAYGRAIPPPQQWYTFDWPDIFGVRAFRLPSQLLGLVLAGGLLFACLVGRRRPRFDPVRYAGLLLLAYGLGDFLIAATRGDLPPPWGPLLAVQWADLALAAAGAALLAGAGEPAPRGQDPA
jgi:prolipoprotein diacylglyceryltransferase